MPRYKRYTFGAVSLLIGVGIGELTPLSFFIGAMIVFVVLLLFIVYKIIFKRTVALLCINMCLIGISYSIFYEFTHTSLLPELAGEGHTFSGRVISEPDIREKHQKVTVGHVRIDSKAYKGNILLLISDKDTISLNDYVDLYCIFEEPTSFDGFDYVNYLRRFNIYAICAFPKTIRVVEGEQTVSKRLFLLRSYLENNISLATTAKTSALLRGVVLGDKRGLGESLSDVFKRTGLTHIVVLSGYNISILVVFLHLFCSRLFMPRRVTFFIITIIIVLFIIMTGASASIIRAGLMGIVVLLGYELRKLPYMPNVLITVALGMVLLNPRILLWDIGWQLSFTATATMLFIVPTLIERASSFPSIFGLRDIAIVTVAANIMTAPITQYYFGAFSSVAIFANLLILPAMPLVMLSGGIVGLVGNASNLFLIWVVPAELCARYVISIAETLARLPFSYFETSSYLGLVLSLLLAVLVCFYVYTTSHVRQIT